MENGEDSIFVHYKFSFTLCRLIDNLLIPSKFNVKAEVSIVDDRLVELAVRKINYWLSNVVGMSVAMCANNESAFDVLLDEESKPRLQNPLMILPEEPTDEHMCVILQSKLQALSSGAFAVGMVELSSDNAEGLGFTFVGDCEDDLPAMDEWIAGPNWFSEPWWQRDDSSTFDICAPEGADLSRRPDWAVDLNFLAMDMMPQEAIVLKGDFTPRIVDKD